MRVSIVLACFDCCIVHNDFRCCIAYNVSSGKMVYLVVFRAAFSDYGFGLLKVLFRIL